MKQQMSLENPQLEDGFTPIANAIMDALARTRFSGYERSVLDFLFRKTYGWSKKSDLISLSQFVDGTGILKPHVVRTIKRLIEKNVIHKAITKIGNDNLVQYEFNKHWGTWQVLPKMVTTPPALPKMVIEPLPKMVPTTSISTTTSKRLKEKDCAEEEKNGAPLFENPDFLIPEEPETKPDKAIQATTSVPYLLASWFYAFRNVPVRPIPADMHYAKLLLQFYSESVIKKGIEWRLSSDPDGYWATHITIAAVYRQFGNWMAESSVKAISLKQWVAKNPDMDFERFIDPLARADGFMRAFNEAKRNKSVYFEDADYAMYKKAIRIKTAESKAETKEKT